MDLVTLNIEEKKRVAGHQIRLIRVGSTLAIFHVDGVLWGAYAGKKYEDDSFKVVSFSGEQGTATLQELVP